jgi:hypothetical protein
MIMAHDLASTPRSGLTVQCCGDAHLSNFGVFASPERRLVFDVNDFDETLPGPWEWDVKRLAASMLIAATDNGFPVKDQDRVVLETVAAYRTAIREFAGTRNLDVCYARLDIEATIHESAGQYKPRFVKRTEEQLAPPPPVEADQHRGSGEIAPVQRRGDRPLERVGRERRPDRRDHHRQDRDRRDRRCCRPGGRAKQRSCTDAVQPWDQRLRGGSDDSLIGRRRLPACCGSLHTGALRPDGSSEADDARSRGRSHGARMAGEDYWNALTARATTRPNSASAAVDWTSIANLARWVSGITSVGLNAVAFVKPRCR